VAAAFWLTAPQLNGRFEVTLYTRGWRLGGKGASGRRLDPDHRIEEHGLHLWLGCYHRAFQMMRLCYAEQPDPKPFKTLADAFAPIPELVLGPAKDATVDGPGSRWRISLPATREFPGRGEPSFLETLWLRAAGCLRGFDGRRGKGVVGPSKPRWSWRRVATQTSILSGLVAVFAKGLLADVVLRPGGFEARVAALEGEDFRAWLARHGACEAIRNSAPVRGLYDLAFAYPNGDCARPGELAAGSTIGLILELFGYRGAPIFKMVSAMGDTIFAPLYRVLAGRGVNFAFFHRLRSVTTDAGHPSVATLAFDRQADLEAGRYEPLIEVAGADCWPDQPLWDQLLNGEALRERDVRFEDTADEEVAGAVTLRQGHDFDLVVLAVPPEVLKATTGDLAHPRWREMLETSASVATQACQMWLDASTEDLGWKGGGLVSAFEPPFSTWADMSHLLDRETWTGPGGPRSLHYFCGPLPDAEADASRPAAGVEATMTAWLARASAAIWPNYRPGSVGRIVQGSARANIDPSERYVQAPPGGARFRLAPDARLYENLYLAGDWTLTRYCGGCVENAVQSGLTAARAISGCPDLGGVGRRWI
jgi:uncharacterized protein with NAD-binding domain and iron-sulfur cluster